MLAYSQPNVLLEKGELEIQQEIKKIASKFRVLTQTSQSDWRHNYSHFCQSEDSSLFSRRVQVLPK